VLANSLAIILSLLRRDLGEDGAQPRPRSGRARKAISRG
jgi:hypothetical protein